MQNAIPQQASASSTSSDLFYLRFNLVYLHLVQQTIAASKIRRNNYGTSWSERWKLFRVTPSGMTLNSISCHYCQALMPNLYSLIEFYVQIIKIRWLEEAELVTKHNLGKGLVSKPLQCINSCSVFLISLSHAYSFVADSLQLYVSKVFKVKYTQVFGVHRYWEFTMHLPPKSCGNLSSQLKDHRIPWNFKYICSCLDWFSQRVNIHVSDVWAFGSSFVFT